MAMIENLMIYNWISEYWIVFELEKKKAKANKTHINNNNSIIRVRCSLLIENEDTVLCCT